MEIKKYIKCFSIFEKEENPKNNFVIDLIKKINNHFQININETKKVQAKIINWDENNQIIFLEIENQLYKVKVTTNIKNQSQELFLLNKSPKQFHIQYQKSTHKNPISYSLETSISEHKIIPSTKTTLFSPLAGKVIKCHVFESQEIKKNQCLFIIESMKIENEIRAEFDAFIKTIPIKVGDLIQPNQPLITFTTQNTKNQPKGDINEE